jgi:hypothetical protein
MCAWRLPPRAAVACHTALVLATLVEMALLDLPVWTWMVAVIGVAVVAPRFGPWRGSGSGPAAPRPEDVEEMAAVAERADLHV